MLGGRSRARSDEAAIADRKNGPSIAHAQESRSELRPKPDSGGGKTGARPAGGREPLARVAREGRNRALPCRPLRPKPVYATYTPNVPLVGNLPAPEPATLPPGRVVGLTIDLGQ
jgi:hypothetical protein